MRFYVHGERACFSRTPLDAVLTLVPSTLFLLLLGQYEILFGEKKKKPAEQNADAMAQQQQNAQAAYPGMVAMAAGASLGLTNDPDQYMLPNSAGTRDGRPAAKKRVHRGFQQLLKKDQVGYSPPSLYQHGVRTTWNTHTHTAREHSNQLTLLFARVYHYCRWE